MKLTRVALAVVASAPLFAHAGLTISPMVGYQTFDNVMKDDPQPQVGLGYRFGDFGVEAVYNQGKAGLVDSDNNRFTNQNDKADDGIGDYKQYRADIQYYLPRIMGAAEPYLAAGVGEIRLEGGAAKSIEGKLDKKGQYTQMNVGGGLLYPITEHWKMRADARYINWSMGAGNCCEKKVGDAQAALGVVYDFGSKPAPVVEQPVVVVPAPVPLPPPPPVDSDRDGVVDPVDQCPDTPMNYAVDAVGCPVELTQPVSIPLKVLFDTNKALIKPEFRPEVAKVAEFLRVYPKATTVIEGHTDARGSATLNKRLSQQRADAVRMSLVEDFGIDPARLTSVGYGKDRPIADNKTEEGRALNRRTVAVVTGEKKVIQQR